MEHLQRQPRAITTDTEFRGRDLRGVSFCDRDLAGADFSDADLRGADFSGTNLARATFTNAHLGVRPRTGALILAAALLISIAAGALIGFYADLIRDTAGSEDWRDRLGAWLLVAVVVLFLALLIVRGARTATLVTAIVLALVAVGDIALVYTVAGEIRYLFAARLIGFLLLAALAALAGILGRIVGGTFGAWAIGLVAIIGGLAAGRANGGLAAIIVSMLLVYLSKRALKADTRDRELYQLAQRIVTRRGTRFVGADLSGADLTGTHIGRADLSHATVTGATLPSPPHPAESE